MTQRAQLTEDQRIDLASELLKLIQEKYPDSAYLGQEDVLLLAYHATTNTPHFRNLLAAS